MFDLSNSLNDLKITGINSITIGVSIDYSEITDVGRWTGTAESLEANEAAGGSRDPSKDLESDTFYGQGLQNLWRFVNLPVAVTASFTGTARHAFPHDMKNGSSLFTRAADFKSSLTKPTPTSADPPPRLTDPTAKEYDRVPRTYDWNRVDRPILITAQKRVD